MALPGYLFVFAIRYLAKTDKIITPKHPKEADTY